MIEKKDIRALSKVELRDFFVTHGDKAFRGNQVYEWLWNKGVHSFEAMTNLPKQTREMLENHFSINHIQVDVMQRSADGTIKNAVRLHDGLLVESVLIPTDTRTTACVSSQVGCSLNCKFCATARLKRMRNLQPDEIFDQVKVIDNQSRIFFNRPLSNIVFMGMGEPLMNYNNVLSAIEKITSDEGLGMSPKRITLSTSGIPKLIRKMADDEVKFKLAVSLHSAIDEVRTSIMPFNENFPLSELREALEYWYRKTKNKITYEYVVWKDINDKKKDVDALIKFCRFAPSKVNLIEYNPIDDGDYQQADSSAIDMYQTMLENAGITVTVRRSRGKDIDAACGQLANKR
ncbi:putative dual-specificity RNA methyltransferase RlmN [Capnocytophaga canis]|uniref:Probable dual-specificity RNA methyltransferase RlmN n=1 Tax=Capnocytophaga canis TaxID=1848903 RepID=A0A0B7ISX0_9FLAO|nr:MULTISPECIES: 23S rRNA (adenine(2503)-C(2))-methyltransferase RlmN [Capnocytophaga]ATA73148.1 23S rRNA (adenine(2503)-C(2))-methyltransferase RlmN [Capnocytophaga sp. H4358]ATA75285.1 23S rRNA (adenine(2503)-C(2))-methyltransferase RlmN [Capnocytophaga sp. H2931]CEN42749.1 putative dual-specificity RNA methyltransferase RlmN [Capnocytophaga canis]CEN45124.1 putative dual-specificity RNA methyltransferase RlmN [Capnocytophaga canis]CEN53068.1 putative dual-specificity RNA methyltransferase R